MDSKAYLRYLQLKLYESNEGMDLNIIDPKSEEAKKRVERAMRVTGSSDSPLDLSLLERLATDPPWMRLNHLAESIYESALGSVSDKDREMLEDKDIAVGFLPTKILNACCIGVGGSSKGCVIAINYAMFYTCLLLSVALIAPHVTGELLQEVLESVYPEAILAASVKATLSPTFENYAELERYFSYLSPEMLGLGSSGLSFMLEYILLHEVGHICNGDIDRGSAYAVMDLDTSEIDYIIPSHRYEYAADEFAMNAFVSNATDPVGVWARLSQIEVFFQFLMYVERAGKLTDDRTHPSAISRLARLRQTMQARWGEDQVGYMKMISGQFEYMGRDLLKDL